MSRDTGLADRLRAYGLDVVEVDGWQSRGSSDFNPRGSVNHHTAGPASGSTPSLGTVVNGRSDLAGPLCNVLQSREPGEGNDKAYVVAAGRANHAGSGGWMGLSGNSSVWGLEIEHTGTSPLPVHRQHTAALIHAAMFGGDPSMLCQHFEWTSRKIDAAQSVDPDEFRGFYAQALGGGFQEEPLKLDDEDRSWIENTIIKHVNGLRPLVLAGEDSPTNWYVSPAVTKSEVTGPEAAQMVADGRARYWEGITQAKVIPQNGVDSAPTVGPDDPDR